MRKITGSGLGLLASFILVPSIAAFGAAPDWSRGAAIPPGGRANPYRLSEPEFSEAVARGKVHAQIYPVEVTGSLPPFAPFKNVVEDRDEGNPLTRLLHFLISDVGRIRSTDQVFEWVGLHPYPAETDRGVYSVPYPDGKRPDYPMGLGFIDTKDGRGFTFSCAECHSSSLFGKTVLGLANRFPRANRVFVLAKLGLPAVAPSLLEKFAGATPGEARMFRRLQRNFRFVKTKLPQVLGLDTSLAQVALSLARRAPDDYATKDPLFAAHPRGEMLAHFVSDGKPAVWWNLKYKDRWLSDGSVVSGNPIYTNILWNEIGRGGDLHELQEWFSRNDAVIRELTTATFSTEAPRFTDFFPPERIDPERARHGQRIFNDTCARCHGHYEKAWDLPSADRLTLREKLETTRVIYHARTPVIDVGTDPGRYLGMESLARGLNPLRISQENGIWIEPQKGYVPPPLVGIWARWPYFHNNSAPSLCAVLTRHEDRPKSWSAGEANDPARDFDRVCNGYPLGKNAPREWRKNREAFYDTSRAGMSNSGHDERIFLKDGKEILSPSDKLDLIQFLQTL